MLKHKIKKLAKTLQNSTIFNEYSKLKEEIENSEVLKNLKIEINNLKKELTKNVRNEEKHNELATLYNQKVEEYETHPLVQKFNYIKEEYENELLFIKEKIAEWLSQL